MEEKFKPVGRAGEQAESMDGTGKHAESMDVVSGESCMICGRQQTEGLHIIEEFICRDCESEMVHTDVMDAKYPFFIHRMKQIWQRKNAVNE